MKNSQAPRYRLFVDAPLSDGGAIEADPKQTHYLLKVLRLQKGAEAALFNGCDGEWRAELVPLGKKRAELRLVDRLREQSSHPSLRLLFAPIKQARLDFLIQKAVELGATSIEPVVTEYTQVRKLNSQRLQANAIEAAEQCGAMSVAYVPEPVDLETLLANWREEVPLIFCDEASERASPVECLRSIAPEQEKAVLIGPEGGFSDAEREMLREHASTITLSLGPRILRAETAVFSALTLIQAICGDW